MEYKFSKDNIIEISGVNPKKCMRCGKIREMKINDRIYNCDFCGLVIDRDYNSAINLANYIS